MALTTDVDPPDAKEEFDKSVEKQRIKRIMEHAKNVLKENKERCWKSFVFYFIALIVVGLPVWWITTSPSRASLVYFGENEAVLDIHDADDEFKTNSPDVWNEISISGAYNIHLVFVHHDSDSSSWHTVEKSIIAEVNRMVNYLSDTVFFSVTTEHLWDIFHSDGFSKNRNAKLSLNGGDMTKFITTVDRYSSPVISTDPLLKFVFVFTKNGIEIDGIQSNGQTFASWGSIINVSPDNNDESYINSIYESFHALLGAQHSLNDEHSKAVKHPDEVAWNQFRHRAFSQNIQKAKHFINAINNLASKIPQLVITSEVGDLVRNSKRFVEEAIAEKNPLKASIARLLAEKAADHSSLIGTGDLTSSLKVGIYVPIGMPLLLPIAEVTLRCLWSKLRNRRHIKVD